MLVSSLFLVSVQADRAGWGVRCENKGECAKMTDRYCPEFKPLTLQLSRPYDCRKGKTYTLCGKGAYVMQRDRPCEKTICRICNTEGCRTLWGSCNTWCGPSTSRFKKSFKSAGYCVAEPKTDRVGDDVACTVGSVSRGRIPLSTDIIDNCGLEDVNKLRYLENDGKVV